MSADGLELEDPRVAVPWGIRPAQLEKLFSEAKAAGRLRFVTDGYYAARCVTLAGLGTQLGFHFRPRSDEGKLAELELFDNGEKDLSASFSLYQRHLEQVFGRPRKTISGSYSPEFPKYEWRHRGAQISHWVMDRFGPEEHVRIVRERLWGLWPA